MAIGFLILVSLLFGCATGVDIDADVQTSATTFYAADPADLPDVQAMVTRLAAATGRTDIAVQPGGILVSLVDDAIVMGQSACAGTFRPADGHSPPFIQVRRGAAPEGKYCMDRVSTMLHEAIHALAPDAVHSDSGVFRMKANRDHHLDAASLEALCTDFACSSFEPEL